MAMLSGNQLEIVKASVHKINGREVCHKSHNFAVPPDYFGLPGAVSHSGTGMSDRLRLLAERLKSMRPARFGTSS
jgi:hypothetical protein